MHLALSVVLGVALVATATRLVSDEDYYKDHRLPKNVIPMHYALRMQTNSHTGGHEFRGDVEIHVEVVEETYDIVLNSVYLRMENVTLYDVSEDSLSKLSRKFGWGSQLVLSSERLLGIGSYILRVKYSASHGMEDGWYKDVDGRKKFFLVTQFEPTEARYVFPCFDEPALKATFDLEIVHHKNQTAVSNMPLDGPPRPLEGTNEMLVSRFQRTPKMSTYLLAWVISEFVPLDTTNHTTMSRASILNDTSYSLQVAKELLHVLDEHTALPYSNYLPKLEHVDIPKPESWWRAKENWGLITYAESILLYNRLTYNAQEQTKTVTTIGHELAHMWFGNLVTPEWWDYVWIKEGFATLYMYYALHLARPSEQWMEWFSLVVIPKGRVRKLPNDTITRVCIHDFDINENYRPAIFQRAAGVLNMFREVMGEERWQTVVRNFLRKHQLSSVVPDDLYREVAEVVDGTGLFPMNITVRETMDSWMTKAGTPMLFIERQYNENKIMIRQYQLDASLEDNGEDWILPYNYAYASSTGFGPVDWISEPITVIDTTAASEEWIVFNKNQFGPYRINYDAQNWKLIAQALQANISSIHRLNRAQLLSDAFYFYEKGGLDARLLFQLVTFLEHETESLVWHEAESILQHIEKETKGSEYRSYYKTFLRHITERYYDHISSNPATSPMDRTVRSSISTLACRAGNEKCLQAARSRFSKAFQANHTSTILPDDVPHTICFGLAQNITSAELRWVLDQFEDPDQDVRQWFRLGKAIGCTKQVDHLRTVVESIQKLISRKETLHRKHLLLEKFGEGLIVDLEERQFLRLAALMDDNKQLKGKEGWLIQALLLSLDKRMHSRTTMIVLNKVYEKYKPHLYRWNLGFDPSSYEPDWEDHQYFMNEYLEDFAKLRV